MKQTMTWYLSTKPKSMLLSITIPDGRELYFSSDGQTIMPEDIFKYEVTFKNSIGGHREEKIKITFI